MSTEKLKLQFLPFSSNWSLYTWLPCWHVYKTTQHACRHIISSNGAFGRRDYFDGHLLNSRTK